VKQCEKIDLSSANLTWKALPDMIEGRWGFNPCLFHEYVYICGAESKIIEAFDPHINRFIPLQYHLSDGSCSCLYVHQDYLVVLSSRYITKFSARRAGQLLPHSQTSSPASVGKGLFNCQPVPAPSQHLVFTFQHGKCYSYNMETGAEVQVFPTLQESLD